MRILSAILLLIIGALFTSSAQNLVPNPSFEVSAQCPNSSSQVSFAAPWTDPNNGSSDYFKTCGTNGLAVPTNFTGHQSARTGDAYVGLAVYYNDLENWREYVQVQLSSTLEYNKNYAVEFYVSLADTTFTAANVGLYFSDTAISQTLPYVFNVSAQVVNDMATNPLTDKTNWTRVSGIYTATGTENYITIGNFSEDVNTDTIMVGATESIGAYYYLDDVSVVCMDCNATGIDEANDAFNLNIYPNPAQNSAAISYQLPAGDDVVLTIYDFTGKTVATQQLSAQQGTITLNTEDYASGIYLCTLVNAAGIAAKRLIVSH